MWMVVLGGTNVHVVGCVLWEAFEKLGVAILPECLDVFVPEEFDHLAVVLDKGLIEVWVVHVCCVLSTEHEMECEEVATQSLHWGTG